MVLLDLDLDLDLAHTNGGSVEIMLTVLFRHHCFYKEFPEKIVGCLNNLKCRNIEKKSRCK